MFDLATAKKRMGITDNSQDTEITATIAVTKELAEQYCDRKFDQMAWTEEQTLKNAIMISLERYPISKAPAPVINGINSAAYASLKYTDHNRGIIYFNRIVSDIVTVQYTGGFAILPAALESAFWQIFDKVHSDLHTASISSSTGGDVIKQVSLTGVASVTFDTSKTVAAVSGIDHMAGIPVQIGSAANILNLYVRERA